MRHTTTISQSATNSRFNFRDIEKALFQNINPEVISRPFPFKKLKNISITYEIPFLYNEYVSAKEVLQRLKEKNASFSSFPFTLSPYVVDDFLKHQRSWETYAITHMEDFCKQEISLINWYTVSNAGIKGVFGDKISYLQKLWIMFNVSRDREFWIKFATDIRESLLPWMNNELWSKMMKNKEATRENVDYEKQRRAMKEGRIEDIDVAPEITEKSLKEELNDLDIVT